MSAATTRNPRLHGGCGGGVEYCGKAPDGRPRFRCTKCGDTWTCGLTGGPWAVLIGKYTAGEALRGAKEGG